MAKRYFKPDALAHCAADQWLELTHQRVHVDRLRLQVLASRERQQLLCNALTPLRCVPGCRQVPLQMIIAAEPAVQQVNISEDNREQVVKVVRDSSGELTDGFHLLRLDQIADHLIDVVLQGRDLPGGLNVIDRVRSPFVTASETSAMARTWVVRLSASWFTLSVRSLQVPATPSTHA